jgi:hypothetical protein
VAWLGSAALAPRPAIAAPELRPVDVRYGDELRLAGYGFTVAPDGRTVRVQLAWQALRAPDADYTAFVHFSTVTDQVVGSFDRPLGDEDHRSRAWRPGELVRDEITVPIDPATPPGVYHLKIGLYRPAGLQRLPITGEPLVPPLFRDGPLRLGPIVLSRRTMAADPAAPKPQVTSTKRFEDLIAFAGHELHGLRAEQSPPRLRAGETFEVRLHLQALRRTLRDVTVFAHLLDGENRVVAQEDRVPVWGTYPTFVWEPGELVVARHRLRARPDLPPGEYEVEVGLYDTATGERLEVVDPGGATDDRIVVTKVVIER